MDLSNIPLFGLMAKRIGWLSRRQEVLSQNVANADTPKYVPHDLKPMDFRRMMRPASPGMSLTTTEPGHLEPIRRPARFRQETDKETYESAPAGNAVILEEQLMKVSETQIDFRMVTTLYQKHIGMLKAVVSRNAP